MSNKTVANIFNIQHFSLQDGDGIRTVVFFKGCPLSCVWCHNPESNSFSPQLAFYEKKCKLCGKCEMICDNKVHKITQDRHKIDRTECYGCSKCVDICNYAALEVIGKDMTIEEIMDEISKDDMFFSSGGGVTLSGGEPFAQIEAMTELAKACKQKGYSVFVETSGYTTRENLEKVIPYIDCFLYDCKETDEDNHIKYTGKSNACILDNLYLLDSLDCRVILRCPIIPGINNRYDHYKKIAELANEHESVKAIEIMAYHPLGVSKCEQIGVEPSFKDESFLDKSVIEECLEFIKRFTDKKVSLSE